MNASELILTKIKKEIVMVDKDQKPLFVCWVPADKVGLLAAAPRKVPTSRIVLSRVINSMFYVPNEKEYEKKQVEIEVDYINPDGDD
jgi:hypothetical protein